MTTPPTRNPDSSFTARLLSGYVALAARHYGKILFCFCLLGALALVPVRKLELHTDMAELLPNEHPAAKALRRIAGRQKSATNLVLIIESPDRAATRRFAKALQPELDKMIPDVFSETQWRPDTEIPDHAMHWRWMYADTKDLVEADELLDRILAHRKSPLVVDLEGDPEAELEALKKRMEAKLPAAAAPPPAPPGPEAGKAAASDAPKEKEEVYFSSDEGGKHSVGVMLWRRRDGIGSLGDHQTMQSVQQAVARLNPTSFHPELRVLYTGHIAMAIAEQNAIREDITVATSICTTLVLLAIYLYFMRLGILVTIGAPAFMGVLLALALASMTLHYLNINTAFLISIILGNGINTPIVLLARYGEERRAGTPVEESLRLAMTRTLLGTSTAMLAASIAYGCLVLTDFRGFSQFGLLGGAGMILVWLSTFAFVPALVLFGERLKPGMLTPGRNLWKVPFQMIGKLSARYPVQLGVLSVMLLVAAAPPLYRYARDPIEWDMRNLRSVETEPEKLWGRMDAMGMGLVGAGYIASTGVLLVDTPDQADPVAEALREKDRKKGEQRMLREVRTIHSVLPKEQDQKLEILSRIRKKIDKHRDLLDDKEAKQINDFRPPEYLRKLTPDDLPKQVREAFTEVDGQRGRLVGVDAENYSDWDGHDLLRLADALNADALGRNWVVASASTIFGGMLEMIYRDGKPVTLAALCGVSLLVLFAFGLRGAWPVLLSLGIGVTWLGGCLGYLQLKLNFMNFVALPITIGIGVEYAANIWARLRAEGRTESIAAIICDTGSAVALCSATTIIGYSSLILARNRALKSFGIVADIGEATCLFAALVVLPVIAWLLFRNKKAPRSTRDR